jgi:hypothetical protein
MSSSLTRNPAAPHLKIREKPLSRERKEALHPKGNEHATLGERRDEPGKKS